MQNFTGDRAQRLIAISRFNQKLQPVFVGHRIVIQEGDVLRAAGDSILDTGVRATSETIVFLTHDQLYCRVLTLYQLA